MDINVSLSLVFNILKILDPIVPEFIVYQLYTQYRAKLRQKEDGKEERKGGREKGEREEGGRREEGIVVKFSEIVEFPQFSFFECSKNVHIFLPSSKYPIPV